jgi:hypothetical protein
MRALRISLAAVGLVSVLAMGGFVGTGSSVPSPKANRKAPGAQSLFVHINLMGVVNPEDRYKLRAWLTDPLGRTAYGGSDTSWTGVPNVTVTPGEKREWLKMVARRPAMGTWQLKVMVPAKSGAVISVGSAVGPVRAGNVVQTGALMRVWRIDLCPDSVVVRQDTTAAGRSG